MKLYTNEAEEESYATEFYLDYVNNYLTVSKIAEHNGMNEKDALKVIEKGKKIYNR